MNKKEVLNVLSEKARENLPRDPEEEIWEKIASFRDENPRATAAEARAVIKHKHPALFAAAKMPVVDDDPYQLSPLAHVYLDEVFRLSNKHPDWDMHEVRREIIRTQPDLFCAGTSESPREIINACAHYFARTGSSWREAILKSVHALPSAKMFLIDEYKKVINEDSDTLDEKSDTLPPADATKWRPVEDPHLPIDPETGFEAMKEK